MPRESRKLPVSTALQSAINLLPNALLAAHDRAHKSSFLLMSWPRGHAGEGWLVLQVSWAITLQDMTNCLEAFVKPFNHFISLNSCFYCLCCKSMAAAQFASCSFWEMECETLPQQQGRGCHPSVPQPQQHTEHLQCHQQGPSQAQWNWGHSPPHSWLLMLPQWRGWHEEKWCLFKKRQKFPIWRRGGRRNQCWKKGDSVGKSFQPSMCTGQVFRSIEVWVLTSPKIWVSST